MGTRTFECVGLSMLKKGAPKASYQSEFGFNLGWHLQENVSLACHDLQPVGSWQLFILVIGLLYWNSRVELNEAMHHSGIDMQVWPHQNPCS